MSGNSDRGRIVALTRWEELLEMAWGLIANAGWDDGVKSPGWQEAAVRWRDEYFKYCRDEGPVAELDWAEREKVLGECRHGCNGVPCGSEGCNFLCHEGVGVSDE